MQEIRTYQDYLQRKDTISKGLLYNPYTEPNIVKNIFLEHQLTNDILAKNGIKIPFDCFNRLSQKTIWFTFHHSIYGSGSVASNCYQEARLHFYRCKLQNFKLRFVSPLQDKFFTNIQIEIIT